MELQKRFGRNRPVCTACGYVHFIEPKVVAAVLVIQNGEVLLVRRVNKPERGKWSLPAGYIDAGEDPKGAAVREVFEETGLQIRVTDLLDVLAGGEHSRSADIIILYRGEIEGGRLTAGDDADAAAFFHYDALPELAFTSTKKVIEDWQQSS
jgi:ADP-ribose pyrophosphatase YjhB (NUDIX family)